MSGNLLGTSLSLCLLPLLQMTCQKQSEADGDLLFYVGIFVDILNRP